MALWGKNDTANDAPSYVPSSEANTVYFVDTTEAQVESNRDKGLKTPGWNKYEEYGSGRKRVETLVALKNTAGSAGDLGPTGNTTVEDQTVADS